MNMDYKYIEQLLESYWQCETSLEEEQILRTFFSQKEVPVSLLRYRDLFVYQQEEKVDDRLGDDFDSRILDMTGTATPVKARTLSLTQRLKPLFKAAAIVAIFLTLGNAAQVAFNKDGAGDAVEMAGTQQPQEGPKVALGDTLRIDTLQANMQPVAITPTEQGLE